MAINKVEFGGETLIDLTGDSVTPETLMEGETAHNAAGEPITGTAKSGGGSVQSDWNVNDETDPAYVKNRTHYISGVTETTVLDNYTIDLTEDWGGMYGSYVSDFNFDLISDNIYIVEWDGVAYECVAKLDNFDCLALGNAFRAGGGEWHNNEPFLMEQDASGVGYTVITFDNPGTHTFSIKHCDEIIVTIPSKFIGVATNLKNGAGVGSVQNLFSTASGYCSHAEGYGTTASGDYSHAEGYNTTASGDYSHVEGRASTASGINSHAEGLDSTASGHNSHAECAETIASGNRSHAEGYNTTASGEGSHAEGVSTTASNYASHAQGKNSKAMTDGGTLTNTVGDAMVIGNGTSSSASSRSNAFRVTFAGETYGLSAFNSSGADYAEFFEWADFNPNAEDRVGYFVTLDGKHIRIANPGDYILGIASGQPCIIGNSDEDWLGRWEHDDFGRFIKEDVETPATEKRPVRVPVTDANGKQIGKRTKTEMQEVETGEVIKGWRYKANPDYDPTQPYIERKDRQEWDCVGMLGVLSVRDDGSCKVNGFCSVADGGIATEAVGYVPGMTYRVIERVSDNVVKVVFR